MTTLRFYTDTQRITKSYKQMFAGASSLIREVAQNAQRAKAAGFWIETDTDKRQLTLRNDGLIMQEQDWQSLFGVAVSNWDEQTTTEQDPFGIGCTTLLVLAETLTVHSGYARATLSCPEFRDGGEVETQDVPEPMEGSEFVMTFNEDTWHNLGLDELANTFAGFSIPVYYNGVEVHRPLAVDATNRLSVPFKYGTVYLPWDLQEVSDKFSDAWTVQLFAQGLPVALDNYPVNVTIKKCSALLGIHLDTPQIAPSAPDRPRLVDPPEDLVELAVVAAREALGYLLDRKADTVGWFEVMRLYPTLVDRARRSAWSRNDACVSKDGIGVLSEDYVRRLSEFSDLEWCDSALFTTPVGALPAHDIPEGLLIYNDEIEIDPLQNEVAFYNFASAFELPMIIESEVGSNHGVLDRGFTGADGETFGDWTVEATNPSERMMVSLPEIGDFPVVFFDTLTVTPPPVILKNGSTVQWDPGTFEDNAYFAVNGTLYVGRNCPSVYPFVGQLDSFPVDPDSSFYERDHDNQDDTHLAIMRTLKALRGDSLAAVLSQAIGQNCQELQALKAQLQGKRFTLSFDALGDPVIEEVAA